MIALDDPLGDLAVWLPRAAALVTEPDTDGTAGGGKPGSRPPWNPSAANALWDALAVIAGTEALFRFLVTGRTGPGYGYAATGAALSAIGSLGHAVPPDRARQAARELTRAVTVIMMLPAIDEAERPQQIPGVECRYCHLPMLMTLPKAGLVYCKRGGFSCWDTNGNPPKGFAVPGRLGPCVEWSDGLVT